MGVVGLLERTAGAPPGPRRSAGQLQPLQMRGVRGHQISRCKLCMAIKVGSLLLIYECITTTYPFCHTRSMRSLNRSGGEL